MGANIEADMETGTATIKPSSLNGAEVYEVICVQVHV